ncbi:MAG TPA: dTDP-4-dehydrorhamnose 3,5-epimerase [Chloroflexota bacterium]|jgi:dTDP-4-dehydrorhamnose 3,5-epimerase|nr:dTDP-4-dehydrorhamnose 3,5-epimerase [Chloroflexota bacterium]
MASGADSAPQAPPAPSPYVLPAPLRGVFLVERPVFADARGFFHEVERRTDLAPLVAAVPRHVQWNHSRSRRGVLRGIHVATWSKCVYVVRGRAQIVLVDARPDEPTFGRYWSLVLGERRRAALWLPPGVGNSFLALSPWVDFVYSVDAEWYPEGEFGIAWDDPDLAIPWQIARPLLSERDQHNPTLRERFPERFAASRPPG